MTARIGVVGGGTMGHGIAAAFALGGHDVVVFEPVVAQRAAIPGHVASAYALLVEGGLCSVQEAKAAEARIRVTDDLALAADKRDFIVEAIPEQIALKQHLFAELDRLAPPDCVFATNTSSLPLAPMLEAVSDARRPHMLVTHWYNPPLVMPLVELSFFGNMADDTFARVAALHEGIGKRTVKVLKDVPGLIANRIQMGVAREVFSLIAEGIASAQDIDRALMFGPAFRYATTGQLEVADFGGLDIWATVADNLLPVMDASRQANPLLRQKVAEGKLGVKSGEGFFTYEPERLSAQRQAFLKRLIHQLKASQAFG